MRITLLIITAAVHALLSQSVKTYYNFYENLNYETPAALSFHTGAALFDMLPVDLDGLDNKVRMIVSVSPFVKQGGEDYGKDVKSAENFDVAKNFCLLFNYEREAMPFISYGTPYKSVLNQNESREIIKKRDEISLGMISDLRKHQVALSLDGLMSTYSDRQLDNGGDYVFRRGGFSARMAVNVKVNKRSSMLLSIASPVFLDFDIDDNYDGPERSYFDGLRTSASFKYIYRKYFFIYTFMYKSFEVFYDKDDGKQLTYPWLTEHGLAAGYEIDKNVRISADYQITPAVFTDHVPDIGGLIRHTAGLFASVNFGSVTVNARYSDSRLFSDDNIGRVCFSADLIYTLK